MPPYSHAGKCVAAVTDLVILFVWKLQPVIIPAHYDYDCSYHKFGLHKTSWSSHFIATHFCNVFSSQMSFKLWGPVQSFGASVQSQIAIQWNVCTAYVQQIFDSHAACIYFNRFAVPLCHKSSATSSHNEKSLLFPCDTFLLQFVSNQPLPQLPHGAHLRSGSNGREFFIPAKCGVVTFLYLCLEFWAQSEPKKTVWMN